MRECFVTAMRILSSVEFLLHIKLKKERWKAGLAGLAAVADIQT